MIEKFGYMRTCGICGGIDIGGKIIHRQNCRSKCEAKIIRLRKLLNLCNEFLKHAPEFPYHLVAEYDIEGLQDELAEELDDG